VLGAAAAWFFGLFAPVDLLNVFFFRFDLGDFKESPDFAMVGEGMCTAV